MFWKGKSVSFEEALRDSIPVLFGYLPLGFVFGLLFTQSGHPWYFAPVMSILSYAGTTQLIAVSMMENHLSWLTLFSTVLIIDLRHIFYSFSLVSRFPNKWKEKWYLTHGLTDETYSILTSKPLIENDSKYCFYLTLLNHCYWVGGTLLGALFGLVITVQIPALRFVLTALFLVLLVEQWLAHKNKTPFLVGLVSGVVALLVSRQNMLLIGLTLSVLGLLVSGNKKSNEESACYT